MQALTWWLTGLPGAGKSTLAQGLTSLLRDRGAATCILDGDILRAGVCSDLGFSVADRAENVRRVAHLAKLLNDQGLHAIVALISPSAKSRAVARQVIGIPYFREIHVSTPLEVCQARDPKGLYAKSRSGSMTNLTGVHSNYEIPVSPILRIDTSNISIEDAVAMIASIVARG